MIPFLLGHLLGLFAFQTLQSWVVSFSHNVAKNRTTGQRGYVTVAIPGAAFSAVRISSYTIRGTQYDRPSEQQLPFFFWLSGTSISWPGVSSHQRSWVRWPYGPAVTIVAWY